MEPAVSTLEKLARVFEVSITEFFRSDDIDEQINSPLFEKIKLIDSLGDEEKQALFKMIDLAISNKKMIQGVWGMEDPSNKTTCESPTCRRLCPCLTGGRGIKPTSAIGSVCGLDGRPSSGFWRSGFRAKNHCPTRVEGARCTAPLARGWPCGYFT